MLPPDDFTSAPPARHLPTHLLRRYAAGELSAAQEHAVELHTLECEQCAEVLEGLEMQPAAVTDASLTKLHQRLHIRVAELAADQPTESAVIPLWWRPLAAAAVLLLTLSAVAWLALRPAARPEIASQIPPATKQVRPANAAADFDGAKLATTDSLAASITPPPPATPDIAAVMRSQRPLSAPVAAPPVSSRISAEEGAQPLGNRQADAKADMVPAAERAAEMASVDIAPAAAPPSTTNQPLDGGLAAKSDPIARTLRGAVSVTAATTPDAARAKAAGRTVRGRIVDDSGQPLPGVTVLLAGTSTGVSSGADGRFALTVPPGSRLVAVSSIGYNSQTRLVKPTDTTLMLALAPDSKQLSEVVIVRREAAPGLPSIGPLPAGGYAAFRQYLHDSLEYPERARTLKLEGTVRLQFIVETDGQLSDIKAVRHLSPECDAEAIRLLKAGPAWFAGAKNGRRTARKVEVNVPFSLDKR